MLPPRSSAPAPDAAPARVVCTKSDGTVREFATYRTEREAVQVVAMLRCYGAVAHVEPPAPRCEDR